MTQSKHEDNLNSEFLVMLWNSFSFMSLLYFFVIFFKVSFLPAKYLRNTWPPSGAVRFTTSTFGWKVAKLNFEAPKLFEFCCVSLRNKALCIQEQWVRTSWDTIVLENPPRMTKQENWFFIRTSDSCQFFLLTFWKSRLLGMSTNLSVNFPFSHKTKFFHTDCHSQKEPNSAQCHLHHPVWGLPSC